MKKKLKQFFQNEKQNFLNEINEINDVVKTLNNNIIISKKNYLRNILFKKIRSKMNIIETNLNLKNKYLNIFDAK